MIFDADQEGAARARTTLIWKRYKAGILRFHKCMVSRSFLVQKTADRHGMHLVGLGEVIRKVHSHGPRAGLGLAQICSGHGISRFGSGPSFWNVDRGQLETGRKCRCTVIAFRATLGQQERLQQR